MPPVPTLSRYELYKAGTSSLISWLITTAAACGFGDPKATLQGSVPVSKLRKCAEAIAKKTPTVHVPGHIVELTEEVIQGRELYAELYKQEEEKKDGHAHFIEVLKQVHATLKETRKKFRAEKPFVKSPGVATFGEALPREHSLQSLFKHLEIEEPVAQPFSTPEKTKTEEVEVDITVKLDPAEERKFVLWCWLEDMVELRAYVYALWKQYARGAISLDCATTTTEVAFACMRRTEEILCADFEGLGFDDWVPLFLQLGKQLNEVDSMSEKRTIMCQGASMVACAMIAELALYSVAHKHKRPYRLRPENEEFAESHPFAKKLLSLVPDFHRAANPIDELRSHVFAHSGNYRLQLSFVMVIQSYQDIYDIIGDPSEIVAKQMTETARRGLEAVDHYELARSATARQGPPSFGDPKGLKAALEHRLKDCAPLQPGFKGKASKMVLAEASIFKALPSSAGEQLKYLKWLISESSAPIANDGFAITGIAYLYRAARYYGLLDVVWEDLECLIKLQSRQRPYIIEVAEHAADDFAFTRHYQMAFGRTSGQKFMTGKKLMGAMRKIESQLEYPTLAQAQWESEELLGCERGEMAHVVLTQIAQKQNPDNTSGRFTSLQLIEEYKKSYIRDEEEVNFSYTDLVASCMSLLTEIHCVVYKRLPEALLDHYGKADVEVVGPILKEAALMKNVGRSMMKAQIALVAKMIEKHIKRQGGKYLKESREKCSGSLSEERKPNLEKN